MPAGTALSKKQKKQLTLHEILQVSRFQALSPEDYRRVMKLVETAILSTDLAMYFKKRNKFLELIENGEFDWQSDDKKEREF